MSLRIVVAPQAFKGSADAHEAAAAIAAGLRSVWPQADIDLIPIADGGEAPGLLIDGFGVP